MTNEPRMAPKALSVVIPARNEASRLTTTLPAVLDAGAPWDLEIIVVDDGSTDGTSAVAEALLSAAGRGRVVRRAENEGKGAAVRAGVLGASGAAVAFMDADLATDLAALRPAMEALKGADIVIGTRVGEGARVRNGTWPRVVMARALRGLVHLFTDLDFDDTQCGFKVFRGDVGRNLFGLSRSRGFAFDVEILLLARRLGYTVVEIPVQWTAVEGSSVRPIRDSLQVVLDLVRITARWTPRRTARAMGRDAAGGAVPRTPVPPGG